MLDRNGVEIVTGMTVRITDAFFKNDNGLFLVAHSPGDPSWAGSDYSLHKIGRDGRMSTAKYNIAFWPLSACVSDRFKRLEANAWNRDHAQIEVVKIKNTGHLKEHFLQQANEAAAQAEDYRRRFGEDELCLRSKAICEHYLAVASRL